MVCTRGLRYGPRVGTLESLECAENVDAIEVFTDVVWYVSQWSRTCLLPAAGKMGEKKKGKQISFIFVVFRKCTRDVCGVFVSNVWSPSSSRTSWVYLNGNAMAGEILFFFALGGQHHSCWWAQMPWKSTQKFKKPKKIQQLMDFQDVFFKTALSILASLSLFISTWSFHPYLFWGDISSWNDSRFWVSRKHRSVEKNQTPRYLVFQLKTHAALFQALFVFSPFFFFRWNSPKYIFIHGPFSCQLY